MKYFLIASLFLLTFPYKCNNPNRKAYPVFGIDISHHQGRVEWDKLKNTDISFIFMKATEGGDYKDSMFLFNWNLANTLKIRRGAYHYFTFCRNGRDQANNFIEAVKLQRGDLPPVIDLEFGGNCKRNVFNREQLTREIKSFMQVIEDNYCEKAIIYTTNEFYRDYISGDFLEHPIWIRDVLSKPHLHDNREWQFWQYRIDTLAGIEHDVDMNVFNGSEAEFQRILVDTCVQKVGGLVKE